MSDGDERERYIETRGGEAAWRQERGTIYA